ncbi:MAG: efflux RND transporter periplasmic adaptor subunit [Chitinophagaceae bacterium]
MKFSFSTTAYLPFIIITSFFFSACGNSNSAKIEAAAAPPPTYNVFTAIAKTTALQTDYPATLQGEQNIEIRPKIDGYIDKIYVDEGATVKKGQLLFRINAPQYKQELNTSAASINSTSADVSAAELQVKKAKSLVAQDIISPYELESAEYTLKVRKSALAQAKASFENARTNLGYTNVTSPVNGVVGTIPYRLGSLVNSTTPMPLTTVSNITNVYAYFSLNEKQLLDFSRRYTGNTLAAKLKQLPPVVLKLADGSEYPEKGHIETIGGLLNTETGSASFRAVFPNPVGLLRSGGSAMVGIPVMVTDAILIPQRSTYELQGKRFVYLVNEKNQVISHEITIANLAAGQYFVVTDGLKAGDKVVYESTGTLADSTVIKPDVLPENKVYSQLK